MPIGGATAMARKRRELVIRTAKQLRALRTPLRQEIVRALTRLGAASVRELADELGREPATLYYHVHALVKAGLVRDDGLRKLGGRPEKLYSLVAQRILIDRDSASRPFLSALLELNRSTLRTAERELEASVMARRTGEPDDTTMLLRLSSRLKPRDAARAAAMLRGALEFMAERDAPGSGDLHTVTVALVRTEE